MSIILVPPADRPVRCTRCDYEVTREAALAGDGLIETRLGLLCRECADDMEED